MSTGWLSRLLYPLIIHKPILPQGHYIIINISLTNSCYIFYCLDLCYDKTVFPPFLCQNLRGTKILSKHINFHFIILSTTTTVTTQSTASILQVFLRPALINIAYRHAMKKQLVLVLSTVR